MKQGFSLVELAIVLSIIGLLVGGILTGQSLIRSAELRSVTAELQTYKSAVKIFRDKHLGLPGDFPHATDMWGSMTNCGVANPSGTGTQTCDGDGSNSLNQAPASSQTAEYYTFWQHLANAGLIKGQYTGISGSGSSYNAVIDENSPASALSLAGWSVSHYDVLAGTSNDYGYRFSDHLMFGGQKTTGTTGGVLTPEETWSIDKKIDDGMSGLGNVIATNRSDCTLSGSATDYEAPYNLQNTLKVCAFRVINAF